MIITGLLIVILIVLLLLVSVSMLLQYAGEDSVPVVVVSPQYFLPASLTPARPHQTGVVAREGETESVGAVGRLHLRHQLQDQGLQLRHFLRLRLGEIFSLSGISVQIIQLNMLYLGLLVNTEHLGMAPDNLPVVLTNSKLEVGALVVHVEVEDDHLPLAAVLLVEGRPDVVAVCLQG